MRMRNLFAALVATGALAFTGSVYAANMSKDQVRQVQQALNNAGQNVEVDGVWGPHTQQALTDFQQGHGLQPTGRLDRDTVGALKSGSPARASGSSGASGTASGSASQAPGIPDWQPGGASGASNKVSGQR